MAILPNGLSLNDLNTRGWGDVAPLESEVSPYSYSGAFHKCANEFQTSGDQLGYSAFNAIAEILMLHLVPGDKAIPFRPIAIFGDKRSLALEDFEAADFEILEEIAPEATQPSVRAYLCDITWVGGRNAGRKAWRFGPIAARAYLEAWRLAYATKNTGSMFDEMLRGLQLAWDFRKQNADVLEAYWKELEGIIADAVATRDLNLLIRTLRIFYERRHGKAGDLAAMAEKACKDAALQGASLVIADLWGVTSDLWRAAENPDLSRLAAIQRGEALVAVGETASTSAMASAHWIQQGLECLRKAKADGTRIEAVHRRLLEVGEAQLEEMGRIGTDFDATDAIKAVRDSVAGLPFLDALIKFSFGDHLLDPDMLRKTVEEQARNTPLQYLIDASVVSNDGKTVAVRPSLMVEGEEYEKAIRLAVIEHGNRYDVPFRAQLFILPARDQIWNEHHPSFGELAFLVRDNPFVPPGHEEAFLRGFVAGFLGDWVVAAHLLIPQVEESIRYLMNRAGAITSNVQADGTQEEKKLHQLFDMPETLTVLGQSWIFELRSLTVEPLGGNLRNRLAHGLLTDSDCHGLGVITLWWLLIRICLTPTANSQRNKASAVTAADSTQANNNRNPISQ